MIVIIILKNLKDNFIIQEKILEKKKISKKIYQVINI